MLISKTPGIDTPYGFTIKIFHRDFPACARLDNKLCPPSACKPMCYPYTQPASGKATEKRINGLLVRFSGYPLFLLIPIPYQRTVWGGFDICSSTFALTRLFRL